MLASPAVRAAGERVGGLAAAGVCFCALFFGGGHSNAPLVWIGGLALVLSALLLALPQRLDPPAAVLLTALVALAMWCGLTTIWSTSPDRSWQFTNRTLACLVAAAWLALARQRVEGLLAAALGGGAGAAVFGAALALPGITSDAQSRATRDHDGWIFALVVLAGGALVAVAAALLYRREIAPARRVRVERVAGIAALVVALAGLAVSIAFAGKIWSEFTNPANTQLVNTKVRLHSAKSDRWAWWQEAWHAFTRHPGGGTGAGTFELTNQMLRHAPVVVDEPHSTPLQFLSETGIVGLLLYLGAAGGALWGAWRARRDPAGLALGLAVAAFFLHGVVDKDWNYVATCGPLFLLAGGMLAQPRLAPERRPLLAACAVACALAAVYSLAAPWLAQRELAKGTAAAFASAHSYDPLSVDALQGLAAFEDRPGHYRRADRLYRDAVALEPQNAETWYALGVFYFEHRAWRLAYAALNNSYTYDRFGQAARPCGLLDQARTKAFGYTPPNLKCPGSKRPASP